jgi:CRP/FNR family cyclic AMP-dependent transcriptional regulator
MSIVSNLELIRRVPLFEVLTPAQAELVAAAVAKKRYKRGESVVEEGKTTNAIYIILSGRARVVMGDHKGGEVILATLRAGDYLGEMSLIDGEAHSATVTTEVQTDVLVLGREDFLRCVGENAGVALSLMRGLVQRLRSADKKIGSLALMGVYGRVATVLLEMAVSGEDSELLIRDKVSRQDLAKMVGASREMVSRVMKEFEEQGFIKTLDQGVIRVVERRTIPR